MKGRRDSAEPGYQIPTLAEMLTMVRRLNERTGRHVGTIPEPKSPRWHREQGQPLEAKLLDQYAAFGMIQRADPVIVQCFEIDALRRMRQELKSDLRMVFLTVARPTIVRLTIWRHLPTASGRQSRRSRRTAAPCTTTTWFAAPRAG